MSEPIDLIVCPSCDTQNVYAYEDAMGVIHCECEECGDRWSESDE